MDFTTREMPPLTLAMRADVTTWLPAVFAGATRNWEGENVGRLRGGRGEVVTLSAGGFEVLVRPYRRGGLPGKFLSDLYFGRQPRPYAELRATETLRERGAPVAEAFGAAVQWLTPVCYRGWIATRFLPGAETLWQWLQRQPASPQRTSLLDAVGAAIRKLHDCGGFHPDLNLNNVLVPAAPETAPITIIDLDRARVETAPANLDAMLARLRRSARKLDPTGRWVGDTDLHRLEQAARQGGTATR